VMVSHAAPLEADHAQPAGAVTLTDPDPPAAGTAAFGGATENVQPTAAWLIVKVRPAIVIVPCRGVGVVFAAAENDTVPLPLPLAPPVTDSHAGAPVTAVQAQPPGAVTDVEPLTGAAEIERPAGEIEYVHGAADCVTVNVRPPIEMVP
jgi:hypothetical protein